MKRLGTVLAAAFVLWLAYVLIKHQGVLQERQRRTADSLHTAQAALDSAASAALRHVAQDSAHERHRVAQIASQTVRLAQIATRAESLQTALRAQISDTVRFDSLVAVFGQREALLTAQRDSALALWRQAAASRDTLATLLRASQAQTHALSQALVQAQRVPWLNRPGVRIGSLAAAFLLGQVLK